ncbi:hypothetical protein JCM10212_004186 [Sporobolomyces blumeae]
MFALRPSIAPSLRLRQVTNATAHLPPRPVFPRLAATLPARPFSQTAFRLSDAPPTASKRVPRSERRLSRLQSGLRVLLASRSLPLSRIRSQIRRRPKGYSVLATILVSAGGLYALYEFSAPAQHAVVAVERCGTIAWAVVLAVVDYKKLFRKTWDESTEEGRRQRHEDYEATHWKAATRLMESLKELGGIYIKLGQHLSTVQLVPAPWALAMRPLQDQCFPTPLKELDALFLSETGEPMTRFFSSFEEEPIGVASLAQVHRAVDRETGREVAVKCMHPALETFCDVDIQTTKFLLGMVKRIFPSFEFAWLGEEMEQNLPLEMDFRHEAANAARCVKDFSDLKKTSVVVPEVLWAKKRVMVMEFVKGGRVDDLDYLARHSIDRNLVSREIAEITSRMIYITGFFHADLHGGNLLIRPAAPFSRSPHNFEVVLLDHGLYFDLERDLRVNYAKFWLSLMASPTPAVEAERRKYAQLVANIDDSHYPLFQAAITGRAALDGAEVTPPDVAVEGEEGTVPPAVQKAAKSTEKRGSMLDLGENNDAERKKMRSAMVMQEGLMEALFQILRNMPRRMLMLFKVNDLNRALDVSLKTTHSPARIFLIIADYCNLSIRLDDLSLPGPKSVSERWNSWYRYTSWKWTIELWVWATETKAFFDWVKGARRTSVEEMIRV